MRYASYEAGHTVITEGRENDTIYFILEGRVGIIQNGRTLYEFGEGNTFGEMEVLDVMPSAATAITLAPTRVMYMSNRNLREIYQYDIKCFSILMMNLARDLSRRLRLLNASLDSIAAGGDQMPENK